MLTQFATLFLFILGVIAIFALYMYKAGLQLQLIRMEQGHPAGKVMDLFFFDFSDAGERAIRGQALLRYPLLFPVEFDEADHGEISDQKRRIKRINIALYSVLILLFIVQFANSQQ